MPQTQWTDAAIRKAARQHKTRHALYTHDRGAYMAAYRRNMLDQLYPATAREPWTPELIRAAARQYPARTAFAIGNKAAYQAAYRRGMLDELFPETATDIVRERWTDAAIRAEAAHYTSRGRFAIGNKAAYQAAYRRGMLDELFPDSPAKDKEIPYWTDAAIRAAALRHPTRAAFAANDIDGYRVALYADKLDQLFPPGFDCWLMRNP